ncbi:MAG: homoserine dehydrogenase, partial [Clostridia bacterium]|nr:homoserine dehydrogenase [Clostridia bacterium]
MKRIIIGMLGCGNIGSGVVRLIGEMKEEFEARYGVEPVLKAILVRDRNREREAHIPKPLLTESVADVTDDPEIGFVIEGLGGEHPAAEYMERALKNGKRV